MYSHPDLTSKPAPGAIVCDWTNETLVLDIQNSLGETFHFEILPGENPGKIRSQSSYFEIDKDGKFVKGSLVKMVIVDGAP